MKFLSRAATACALLASLAVSAPAARADDFSAAQKAQIGDIIRDYLLKNPEVLRDAMMEFDRRQKAAESAQREQALDTLAPKIYNSRFQSVIGNPQGKITLVEFFDYNCGYCKKSLPDLVRLTKENSDLRVVLKDFPVLGPGSVEAAQVASAVRNQLQGEKFWEFHQRLLMTHGQVGKAQAIAAARESGVDLDRLDKDMKSADIRNGIAETMQVADQLSLTGTPSWVLGKEVVIGAVGYDELHDKLDNMKKCGKTACG
ncbi:MAG: DsbA family protein [Hyphomicrobiales bacterium]|nr:DsbA family protein [Hyphomicrobiales bacterium]